MLIEYLSLSANISKPGTVVHHLSKLCATFRHLTWVIYRVVPKKVSHCQIIKKNY